MPMKLNRAGKMQPYMPKSHPKGGEYTFGVANMERMVAKASKPSRKK